MNIDKHIFMHERKLKSIALFNILFDSLKMKIAIKTRIQII